MKTLITLFVLWTISPLSIFAQKNFYNFSIYTGFSPTQTPYQSGTILNRQDPLNEFVFNLKEIEKSYLFGLRKNFRFSHPFYGTLGLEYTKLTNEYSIQFTQTGFGREKSDYAISTTSHSLHLPAGIGVKMRNLDITSGLLLQYAIKTTIEEELSMGIELIKPQVEWGWYTGVGFSFDRTRIGLQYQSSMKRCGSNLMYQGKPMELMNVPGYLRFTVGYSF